MKKTYVLLIILIVACLGYFIYHTLHSNDKASPITTTSPSNDQEQQTHSNPSEALIKSTVALAKQGKVIGSDFVVGQSDMKHVRDSWGKPDGESDTARGIYATYKQKHITLGYHKDAPVFDLRSDNNTLHQLTFTEIKQQLGDPSEVHFYKDKQHDQKILVYDVNQTYQLKFILPKPTEAHPDPHVDHISVYSPKVALSWQKNITIDEQIAHMSLDEKIGQMVIVGMTGPTLDENTRTLIDHYKVGGLILYQDNIQTTAQTLKLLNSLKSENTSNRLPLFLSVDQEGGRITRLPKTVINFPTNQVIGQVNNKQFSYKIGTLLGKELAAFGLNMDFAPVLDINSNPDNPVIGDRSFGPDPKIVSSLGVQTMKGIQSQNIISVVKHFPGHGDTTIDSHLGLPKVNYDLDHLRQFELVPFAHAIDSGADVVMVAHILWPKIDANYPASMSKKIITDILRGDLGYDGVVMSDDMTMGAITENYSIGDAAVRAVLAGSNILLVTHHFDKEVAAIDALKTAVKNGVISEKQINDSVYKIIQLKRKYKLTDEKVTSINIPSLNQSIQALLNKYMPK